MTEPRLHLLARQAASRIALGHDPAAVVLSALCELSGAYPLGGVYDQLPPRSRAICKALWGEGPMRACDVYRIVGGSYHSVHELLKRLMYANYVRRTRYGHYAIQCPSLQPTQPRALSRYRAAQPLSDVQKLQRKIRRIQAAHGQAIT